MPNIVVKEGSRPPWVGLAAAVWVLMAAGNGYNFPLYSPSLKSVLGFNQQQLTILGVANDIGESVGLLPGVVCNKFPPWALLSVGVVFCFLGYGVLWFAITQSVSGLLYWVSLMGFPNLITEIAGSMGLGNPTGALLVSGLLAGYAYDAEAAQQDNSACVGHDCFEVTFLVLAGVCGFGTILSIILTVRIRPVYQLLYSEGSFRLPQTPGH
ncbi:hypothetical protein POTOM_013206 [Populus tomentosa]|uniref:Nodulin-like domain-containing protein n=1 Tax=Populus tomentosa TaxID=118781 RepID=A0A8X8D7B5_POPTO|nr:hypothetical protein POTOM_013206 [Populus tomentosa]